MLQTHMKDPAKGQEQAIDRNKSAHIFLPIRDTPRNVYIERKLRISRFRKNKIFLIFDAFLHPKRYLSKNVGFWVFEVGTQNFGYRENECELFTNILLGKGLYA